MTEAIIMFVMGFASCVGMFVAMWGGKKVWTMVKAYLDARAKSAESDLEAKVQAILNKAKPS